MSGCKALGMITLCTFPAVSPRRYSYAFLKGYSQFLVLLQQLGYFVLNLIHTEQSERVNYSNHSAHSVCILDPMKYTQSFFGISFCSTPPYVL